MTSMLEEQQHFRVTATGPLLTAKPAGPCSVCGDGEEPRCACHRLRLHCQRFNATRIPAFLAHATFQVLESDPSSSRSMLRAVQWLKAWCSRDPLPPHGILLSGPQGTGKSFAMAALLRRLTLQQGVSCLFIDFAELLLRLKAGYSAQGSEYAIYEELVEPEVLVLDDVGSYRDSPWSHEVFQTIIALRYNACGRTFLTTNRLLPSSSDGSPAPFERWAGPHSASRLKQMCYWLRVDGPDRRRQHLCY
jgi:DNA replication protein DnaC